MPVKAHYTSSKAYYQYGSQKKYFYKPGDLVSRKKALKKARLQERMIKLSGYKEKK